MTKNSATNRNTIPIIQKRLSGVGSEAKKSLIKCFNFYLGANMVEFVLAYGKAFYFCTEVRGLVL